MNIEFILMTEISTEKKVFYFYFVCFVLCLVAYVAHVLLLMSPMSLAFPLLNVPSVYSCRFIYQVRFTPKYLSEKS